MDNTSSEEDNNQISNNQDTLFVIDKVDFEKSENFRSSITKMNNLRIHSFAENSSTSNIVNSKESANFYCTAKDLTRSNIYSFAKDIASTSGTLNSKRTENFQCTVRNSIKPIINIFTENTASTSNTVNSNTLENLDYEETNQVESNIHSFVGDIDSAPDTVDSEKLEHFYRKARNLAESNKYSFDKKNFSTSNTDLNTISFNNANASTSWANNSMNLANSLTNFDSSSTKKLTNLNIRSFTEAIPSTFGNANLKKPTNVNHSDEENTQSDECSFYRNIPFKFDIGNSNTLEKIQKLRDTITPVDLDAIFDFIHLQEVQLKRTLNAKEREMILLQIAKKLQKAIIYDKLFSIDKIIKLGLIPIFIECLDCDHNHELQYAALLVLDGIVSGTPKQVKHVTAMDIVPKLLRLCSSNVSQNCIVATVALCSIVKCDLTLTNLFILYDAMPFLLNLVNAQKSVVFVRNIALIFFHLSLIKCPPIPTNISNSLLKHMDLLLNYKDQKVTVTACRVVQNLLAH